MSDQTRSSMREYILQLAADAYNSPSDEECTVALKKLVALAILFEEAAAFNNHLKAA